MSLISGRICSSVRQPRNEDSDLGQPEPDSQVRLGRDALAGLQQVSADAQRLGPAVPQPGKQPHRQLPEERQRGPRQPYRQAWTAGFRGVQATAAGRTAKAEGNLGTGRTK